MTEDVTAAPVAAPSDPPVSVVAPGPSTPISYGDFGHNWIRRVVHCERVVAMVQEILGPTLELGPIGAGPGRAFASVRVRGQYGEFSGEEVKGTTLLTYLIKLPIKVAFDLEMPLDKLTFKTELEVPIRLVVHAVAPVGLRIEIQLPNPEGIDLNISSETRRGQVFQRVTGLEGELRRFLPRVLETELSKPYVQKALNLDMLELIDGAWPELTKSFLPQHPDDRKA